MFLCLISAIQQSDSVVCVCVCMYVCMYTHSFSCSFPLWFITGYWLYFPVLYSRTLLLITCASACSLFLGMLFPGIYVAGSLFPLCLCSNVTCLINPSLKTLFKIVACSLFILTLPVPASCFSISLPDILIIYFFFTAFFSFLMERTSPEAYVCLISS